MTLGEAAEALGLSTSTLRRWADAGRIQTLRTSGGHRRFRTRDVQRLSATRAAGRRPVVRSVPPPVEPLPALSGLLTLAAPELAATSAQSLYDGPHTGWFSTRAGRQQLERWALAIAAGARTGDHETSTEATRRLMLHASLAGATLLERHTIMERLGELIVRELQGRATQHAEIVDTRRLLLHLRHLVLEADPAHR